MANLNPIKMTDSGKYPDFIIPKSFADKTLCIKTKTELDKSGWVLDLIHALSLDGNALDFQSDPDIIKAEIGKCSELNNSRLSLVSIASRIRNGGENPPAKVIYSITFIDEKENSIESFTLTSDNTNPVTFYTKITLKIES